MSSDAGKIRELDASLGWGMVAFFLGLLVTSAGLVAGLRANTDAANAEFKYLSTVVARDIQSRLLLPGYGLGGVRGTIAANGRMLDVEQFRRYVGSRDLAVEFPGVTGFGLIVPVPRVGLAGFERDLAREHGRPIRVRTSGDRPDMFVIKSIEPLRDNLPAIGFDVGSEAARRAAVQRVLSTGKPAATAPVRLLQDRQGRLGTLYLVPVFRSGAPRRQGAEDEIVAFAYAALTYSVLLDGVIPASNQKVGVELHDLQAPVTDRLVFTSDAGAGRNAAYSSHVNFDFGGRPFELRMVSTRDFERGNSRLGTWLTAGMGLLATLLATALVMQLASSRIRAQLLARQMGSRARQLALVAQEITDAVVLLDSGGRATWANASFLTLSGLDERQLAGKRPWDLLLSARSDVRAISELRQALLSGRPYAGPLHLQNKDGREFAADLVLRPFPEDQESGAGYIAVFSGVVWTPE